MMMQKRCAYLKLVSYPLQSNKRIAGAEMVTGRSFNIAFILPLVTKQEYTAPGREMRKILGSYKFDIYRSVLWRSICGMVLT